MMPSLNFDPRPVGRPRKNPASGPAAAKKKPVKRMEPPKPVRRDASEPVLVAGELLGIVPLLAEGLNKALKTMPVPCDRDTMWKLRLTLIRTAANILETLTIL